MHDLPPKKASILHMKRISMTVTSPPRSKSRWKNLVKWNTVKDLEAAVMLAEKQMCLGCRGAESVMEEASPVNSGNVDI